MKSLTIFSLISLFLIIMMSFTVNAVHLRKSLSKSRSANQPNHFSQLRQQIFDEKKAQEPSIVEQKPWDIQILNPLSEEENSAVWPKNTYAKDDAPYYPIPATKDNIKDADVLLVSNLTAIREFDSPFFDDGIPHRGLTKEKKYPINQKDPKAYYNPINERNQYKQTNLFSVPIDFKSKYINEDYEKEIAERNRLAIKPKYYYDASRKFGRDTQDPIVIALQKHQEEKLKPKSQNYNDFIKEKREFKDKVDKILGKFTPYDETNGRHVISQMIRQSENAASLQRAELQVPLPAPKANNVGPYYDASASTNTST